MPKIVIAKLGTYCQAPVPDKSYWGAHDCSVKSGIKKHRGLFLCARHRKARLWR